MVAEGQAQQRQDLSFALFARSCQLYRAGSYDHARLHKLMADMDAKSMPQLFERFQQQQRHIPVVPEGEGYGDGVAG